MDTLYLMDTTEERISVLAKDLTDYFEVSSEEALERLKRALEGEVEPIVLLSDDLATAAGFDG